MPKQRITREQFLAYERVRLSGETDMLDLDVVSQLSGLSRDAVDTIVSSYNALARAYLPRISLRQHRGRIRDVILQILSILDFTGDHEEFARRYLEAGAMDTLRSLLTHLPKRRAFSLLADAQAHELTPAAIIDKYFTRKQQAEAAGRAAHDMLNGLKMFAEARLSELPPARKQRLLACLHRLSPVCD